MIRVVEYSHKQKELRDKGRNLWLKIANSYFGSANFSDDEPYVVEGGRAKYFTDLNEAFKYLLDEYEEYMTPDETMQIYDYLYTLGSADETFYHSFYEPENRKTKQEIVDFLSSTDKPIKYTIGYKYKHPTTYEVLIDKEKAIKIAKSDAMYDVEEYDDWVDFNAFSGSDLW